MMGGSDGVLLLDGGFGHELKERGVSGSEATSTSTFLAGALANQNDPSAVVGLHREYIRAGCDVLTTNSFVLTPHHLAKAGLGRTHLQDLVRKSVANAAEARAMEGATNETVRIAGCLPPLAECYDDDDSGAPPQELSETYAEILACLNGVDIVLVETIGRSSEALACLDAISSCPDERLRGAEVWVSFTLADDRGARLRGGEPLVEAALAVLERAAAGGSKLECLLVNCCAPSSCEAGLAALASSKDLRRHRFRVGAYANGFLKTTDEWLGRGGGEGVGGFRRTANDCGDYDDRTGLILPFAYARWAKKFVAAGASVVGGCCGVGVEAMAAASDALKR